MISRASWTRRQRDFEKNIGFGHRLSILDISSSGTFLSETVYVMTGEIYNFKEFYPELKVMDLILKPLRIPRF
jgi:asparagine synthetase B (glutamine-hydrolysing)